MEGTNLDRKIKNLLKPLDRGFAKEIVTWPLNAKSRKMLYALANSRGYHYEKVEASRGFLRKLACKCGTPYGSGNVDWDSFTIEPHCSNMGCDEYGYLSNQVAIMNISDAKKARIACLESVDVILYTIRVWKPE